MSRATRKLRAARRGQRGAALIELAFVLPFLLLLTLATVDMSRAFMVKNMLHQSAREGVRRLAVSTMADSSAVRGRVLDVANAAGISVDALTLQGPDANSMVRVTVGTQFNWLFPGLFTWVGASFTNPMALTATAVMRAE